MGKEGFIAFLNKTKTSKYYITFNIRLSCIFSVFYKICLYYLCYERLFICTENGKRERNGFSKNYQQKVALGAKKMCLRQHFSPLQKGKKRGAKEGWRELEKAIFRTYFTLFTRVRGRNRGTRREIKPLKPPLQGHKANCQTNQQQYITN